MGVKPAAVDSDAVDVLDQLNDVRLTRDWSYRQLADDIEKVTGYVVSAQTLQPLLSVPRHERSKPFDRTLHKIRRYLDARPTPRSIKPPRKAKASRRVSEEASS